MENAIIEKPNEDSIPKTETKFILNNEPKQIKKKEDRFSAFDLILEEEILELPKRPKTLLKINEEVSKFNPSNKIFNSQINLSPTININSNNIPDNVIEQITINKDKIEINSKPDNKIIINKDKIYNDNNKDKIKEEKNEITEKPSESNKNEIIIEENSLDLANKINVAKKTDENVEFLEGEFADENNDNDKNELTNTIKSNTYKDTGCIDEMKSDEVSKEEVINKIINEIKISEKTMEDNKDKNNKINNNKEKDNNKINDKNYIYNFINSDKVVNKKFKNDFSVFFNCNFYDKNNNSNNLNNNINNCGSGNNSNSNFKQYINYSEKLKNEIKKINFKSIENNSNKINQNFKLNNEKGDKNEKNDKIICDYNSNTINQTNNINKNIQKEINDLLAIQEKYNDDNNNNVLKFEKSYNHLKNMITRNKHQNRNFINTRKSILNINTNNPRTISAERRIRNVKLKSLLNDLYYENPHYSLNSNTKKKQNNNEICKKINNIIVNEIGVLLKSNKNKQNENPISHSIEKARTIEINNFVNKKRSTFININNLSKENQKESDPINNNNEELEMKEIFKSKASNIKKSRNGHSCSVISNTNTEKNNKNLTHSKSNNINLYGTYDKFYSKKINNINKNDLLVKTFSMSNIKTTRDGFHSAHKSDGFNDFNKKINNFQLKKYNSFLGIENRSGIQFKPIENKMSLLNNNLINSNTKSNFYYSLLDRNKNNKNLFKKNSDINKKNNNLNLNIVKNNTLFRHNTNKNYGSNILKDNLLSSNTNKTGKSKGNNYKISLANEVKKKNANNRIMPSNFFSTYIDKKKLDF